MTTISGTMDMAELKTFHRFGVITFCGRDSPGYLAAYADEQFFDSALSAKGQA